MFASLVNREGPLLRSVRWHTIQAQAGKGFRFRGVATSIQKSWAFLPTAVVAETGWPGKAQKSCTALVIWLRPNPMGPLAQIGLTVRGEATLPRVLREALCNYPGGDKLRAVHLSPASSE